MTKANIGKSDVWSIITIVVHLVRTENNIRYGTNLMLCDRSGWSITPRTNNMITWVIQITEATEMAEI